MALRGAVPIAGAFNVQKGDALYGRYWGASEFVKNLHFVVCYYAGIEHCIRQGLVRFEPGAGGDYKQVRGFDAQPTWSAHFLAEPRLNRLSPLPRRERTDGDAIERRERSAPKPAATEKRAMAETRPPGATRSSRETDEPGNAKAARLMDWNMRGVATDRLRAACSLLPAATC
jgi:hypothetical protein